MLKKILCCLLFIIVISGCSSEKILLDKDYFIETVEKNNCRNTVVEYYEKENQKIYLFCLEKINLYDNNSKIGLKNYIKQNQLSINEITKELTSKLKHEETLWDGGTQIYRDNGDVKYSNNGLTIIKCNTVDNNQDVYIGPSNMEKQIDFCK